MTRGSSARATDTYRWTNRMHGADHDAQLAAERTSDVMTRILEDLRLLDAQELGLARRETPAEAFAGSRVG